MRRMDAAAAGEALAARMERRAAKPQFMNQMHQPIADLPAFMTATLMRKERDLVAVRHGLLLTSISANAQSPTQRRSSPAIRRRESRFRPWPRAADLLEAWRRP